MKINKKAKKRMFSLMEVIIAITIVALIAAIAVKKLGGQTNEAKIQIASAEMSTYIAQITQFQLKNGKVPESLSEVNDGEAALDPWKNEYKLETAGNSYGFQIVCLGADGSEGGEGPNEDIIIPKPKR